MNHGPEYIILTSTARVFTRFVKHAEYILAAPLHSPPTYEQKERKTSQCTRFFALIKKRKRAECRVAHSSANRLARKRLYIKRGLSRILQRLCFRRAEEGEEIKESERDYLSRVARGRGIDSPRAETFLFFVERVCGSDVYR